MPDNESPRVAVAREAASKLKAKAAIVIYVSEDGEKIGMASYGRTPTHAWRRPSWATGSMSRLGSMSSGHGERVTRGSRGCHGCFRGR